MKKIEKVAIIKWYIREKCASDCIQTFANNTNDLQKLESLVMNHRTSITHISDCSSCWWEDRDYCSRCRECKDGSHYTFPYGYWKKVCERRDINIEN
jgi:hypothetical protein